MKHARLVPIVEDTLLTAREIEARLSDSFPQARFDWDKANAKLQSEYEWLLANNVAEPIVRGHQNLFDNVVWVRIPVEGSEPIEFVEFYAYPDSYVRVEVPSFPVPANFQNALEAIAKALDYCVEYAEDA